MTTRRFRQIDVFTGRPLGGNPVAVVVDASGLTTGEMQRLAAWTNLSETTFVLPPTERGADYRVRIFTPSTELPFAGHPTLGTCHAWLECGGVPARTDLIVQECGIGLVSLRRADRLAFAAPPLVRSGPVDEPTAARVRSILGVADEEIEAMEWVDNGPGWIGVLLHDVERLRSLSPGAGDLDVGVAARRDDEVALEVRAFFPVGSTLREDPVTGSLNASLATWLVGTGRQEVPYVAAQGAAVGADGRVHVDRDTDGTIWVGGDTATVVAGEIELD